MVRFRPPGIFMYENAECTKSNFNTKAVPDTDVRAIKKRIKERPQKKYGVWPEPYPRIL